ncbi:MAG: nucleoid occlusion factor SlmA [Pseudomonadales bacterium]|nr:nucleoid occlusion factor SlmA [Pseudomonadales bacterium]
MPGRIKTCKRQLILNSLANILGKNPGGRVTTAKLATEVGMSEAAIYRHFPSKTKIFEGLIDQVEETLFSSLSDLRRDANNALDYCEQALSTILSFSEANPGMSRILSGDALTGKAERLRSKALEMNERLEALLSKTISDAEEEGMVSSMPASAAANLIFSAMEGRISQFVRSGFKRMPTTNWQLQWQHLSQNLFSNIPTQGTS